MAGTVKSGSRALERILRDHGRSLDRRTGTAKEFYQIVDALTDERGGAARLSVGEQLLIERAASLVVICRAVERYVLREGVLNNGQLAPVLAKNYTSYAEVLRRTLLALHVRPDVVERLPDVSDYFDDEQPAEVQPT
jgi:hypothetical protein